jgi:hypothetical protein
MALTQIFCFAKTSFKKKQGTVLCSFSKRDFKLFIGDFWMKGWLFCIPQSQA